jgi:DNA modification methylase
VIEDLCRETFDHTQLRVITGDCRASLPKLAPESYDLWVTSPPYLNSFDYSDVYRPELFAAGFVDTNSELRNIRRKTLCSHVQVKREYTDEICSSLLKPALDEMAGRKLWSPHLPGMIRTYFADLSLVCEQVHPLLRRGGKAWIVVSTSAYAGVEIPVDLILADVASKAGWNLCGIYVLRQLRAAGQHWNRLERGSRPPLRESLLVLEK